MCAVLTGRPFLENLWVRVGFQPNDSQREAILHVDGPLYLPAGPGSGKTRVLLWRTLNLIVYHGVSPEEIYLSTFTEKAAFQLREGLRALLAVVTSETGQPYDISKMYVGTVHSLCQRLIADRRFHPHRRRGDVPALLDELGQYFYLRRARRWTELTRAAEFPEDPEQTINQLFGVSSYSNHLAVSNCISLFNRLSEECIDPLTVLDRVSDPTLEKLLWMYQFYKDSLREQGAQRRTDFSLLQQEALSVLTSHEDSAHVFKHVIVDEYQDTNTVQERIFFSLARGHGHICVVGDDDQALYRFRGATVENFVQFPERCKARLGVLPRTIPLVTNYRSRKRIVDFYNEFMGYCDWSKAGDPSGSYRVLGKRIVPHRREAGVSVVASTAGKPPEVCAEIARLVRGLIDQKKVRNENQIAFLFPSLKSSYVRPMREALEAEGLRVYAPRAGRFLEVEEAVDVFAIYLHVFGRPVRGNFSGRDYDDYHDWLDRTYARGEALIRADPHLATFVADRKEELETVVRDYNALMAVVQRNGWDLAAPYDVARMRGPLLTAGLSRRASRAIASPYLERIVLNRLATGRPLSLRYVVTRATSLDWSLLDLFYRLTGFAHLKRAFDLAESGEDEGPICNLGLVSQYLARFMDEYALLIRAEHLKDDQFQRLLFMSYLYALFRRGESEYEDAEDPFPKGRIPFLTIHQAKGLEFPVVVLGNPRTGHHGPQRVEGLVRPLLDREGEPLERTSEFDTVRMFYVALSRAQNLLVIAHWRGPGHFVNEPFKRMLGSDFPRIPDLDLDTAPEAEEQTDDLPRMYSYSGDYLLYRTCPREYLVFRKYGFVPSRSQLMTFGNLVHRTVEDLHQYLISRRAQR